MLLDSEEVGSTVDTPERRLEMVTVDEKVGPLLGIPAAELTLLLVKLEIPVGPTVKLELLAGNGAVLPVPGFDAEVGPEETEL